METRFENPSGLWKLKTFIVRPRKLLEIFRDKRTPVVAKLLPLAAIAYLLFPIDVLPDFIPVIGQIDDLSIALYLISWALDLVPDAVYRSAGITLPRIRETEIE